MKDEIANLDATAQAELVRKREVSPLELVDAAIAGIEKVNPRLNAVITPLFEKARAQAKSAPAAIFRACRSRRRSFELIGKPFTYIDSPIRWPTFGESGRLNRGRLTWRHGRPQSLPFWGKTQMPDKDARDRANPGSEGGHNRATILLVDDNNDVREVTTILLNDLGYAVIEAESGQAVLAQLESGTTADLLMVDFAMPGMSGLELVTQARAKWPALKVVFVTGYAGAPHVSNLLLGEAIVKKPFSATDLKNAINQALARP